jgi:hypothetical protein
MSWIPVFMASQLEKGSFPYGFSVYQGVLVQWDEDFDQRVLLWIDSLTPQIRTRLYSASEREGTLDLTWKHGPIPKALQVDGEVSVRGDSWCICESRVLALGERNTLFALPACDAITQQRPIS